MSTSAGQASHSPSEVLNQQFKEADLNELWEEVEEEVNESELDDAQEQFLIYSGALAVHQALEDEKHNMRAMEIGGGAVLTHLYDEEGAEVFETWRGTKDSDKYVMARGTDGTNRQIDNALKNAYGNALDVTESANDGAHDGLKYTVHLPTGVGKEVEFDLMTPFEPGAEEYAWDDTETVEVAGTEITVLGVRPLLFDKLTTYANKVDDGAQQEAIDKEAGDVASLLHVQEQRYDRGETDVDAKDLYHQFRDMEVQEIDSNMEDVYVDALDWIDDARPHREAAGTYTPSEDFVDF